MYLPATELQLFQGQFTCPYCIMDLRDRERKSSEGVSEKRSEHGGSLEQAEKCERCSRTMTIVYFYNGRMLCGNCVNDEKSSWKDVGGERPPLTMFRVRDEKEKQRGLFAFLAALLQRILEILKIVFGKKKSAKGIESKGETTRTKAPAEKSSPFGEQGLVEKPATGSKELAGFKDVKEIKPGRRKSREEPEKPEE